MLLVITRERGTGQTFDNQTLSSASSLELMFASKTVTTMEFVAADELEMLNDFLAWCMEHKINLSSKVKS